MKCTGKDKDSPETEAVVISILGLCGVTTPAQRESFRLSLYATLVN